MCVACVCARVCVCVCVYTCTYALEYDFERLLAPEALSSFEGAALKQICSIFELDLHRPLFVFYNHSLRADKTLLPGAETCFNSHQSNTPHPPFNLCENTPPSLLMGKYVHSL